MICYQLQDLQTNLAALVIAAERTDDINVSELPEIEKGKHELLKQMIAERRVNAENELASHVAKHQCAN